MRHPREWTCLSLAVCSCVAALANMLVAQTVAADGALPLIPAPAQITTSAGTVDLSGMWCVEIDSNRPDSSDIRAAHLLVEEARARGWSWHVGARPGASRVRLRTSDLSPGASSLAAEQGYSLSAAPRHIIIEAPSATGRWYGVQTLRQLIRGVPGGQVPKLVIKDVPSLAVRGVSDDVARGQISTLADFGAIVRELSFLKINLYQPYIESAFRFRSTPRQGADPVFEPNELAELVREGERYHVRVVPILETLSHQDGLLSESAYQHLAETVPATPPLGGVPAWLGALFRPRRDDEADGEGRQPSPGASTFCATDPKALRQVLGMVDEVAVVTSDPWFHLGGDECGEIAVGRSASAVRARGFGRVYADWFGAVSRRLASMHRRRAMLYADMALAHPDALSLLPRDVVMVDWHYDPADTFSTLAVLRRAGFEVVSSSAMWNWRTFYPHYVRALPNIAHAADAARREHGIGMVVASWCDGGTESLREFNWPGYAYAAAAAWQSRSPDSDDVLGRYALLRYGARGGELAQVELDLAAIPPPRYGWWGRAFHAPIGVRTRTGPWLAQMQDLQRTMIRANTTMARVSGQVDGARLAVLRHAVSRFHYLADREIVLDQIARRVKVDPRRPDSTSAAELRSLADRLRGLTLEYGRLWSLHNRTVNQEKLTGRLSRQEATLRKLADRAENGTLGSLEPAVARLP